LHLEGLGLLVLLLLLSVVRVETRIEWCTVRVETVALLLLTGEAVCMSVDCCGHGRGTTVVLELGRHFEDLVLLLTLAGILLRWDAGDVEAATRRSCVGDVR
jgi:hypothetical protein